MATSTKVPEIHAYISTHDTHGQSIFSPDFPSTPTVKPIGRTASTFADVYLVPAIPASLSADLAATRSSIASNAFPGAVPSSGAALRVTNTPPGQVSPMHRTLSVDFAVVVAGSIELVLESGEKRLLRTGDTVVQRATMHQWRNPSPDEWCRMICVMMPLEEGAAVGEGDDRTVLKTEFKVPGKA